MRLRMIGALTAVVLAAGAFANHSGKTPAPAPDVGFVTLQGESFRTPDLRGKVVLVNFWATTCASCIKEMPMLVKTHAAFAPRGLETVAVAMDYDLPALVKTFAERYDNGAGLPFKVALDVRGEVARGFDEVRLTPTTIVVDKRGRIAQRYLGEPDFDRLHALLERLLDEPA